MAKVYINVTTRLIIELNDGVDVDEIISEMAYSFSSTTKGALITNTEIVDYVINDISNKLT